MIARKCGVVRWLVGREAGLGWRLDGRRRNHMMLRSLICHSYRSGGKTLVKLRSSKGPFISHAGRMFVRNANGKSLDCLAIDGSKGKMVPLYSIPCLHLRDQEIWEGPVHHLPLPNKGHRASLFMLTVDNVLRRFDLWSGVQLEGVFLSPTHKFIELLADEECQLLVAKSTRGAYNADLVVVMAVFAYPQLRFRGVFEVKKSVFGKTAIDASIYQGCLLVLHSNGTMHAYDMADILHTYTEQEVSLGQCVGVSGPSGGQVVGRSPLGLPTNIRLHSPPHPILLNIRSVNHHLQLGGRPWHYISHSGKGVYEVCDLVSGKVVKNGRLVYPESDAHTDLVLFHPDDSSRIMHMNSSELRVYNLVGPDKGLECQFRFSAEESDPRNAPSPPSHRHPHPSTSRSRSVRERHSKSKGMRLLSTLDDTSYDLTYDYEDELDLLGVVSVRENLSGGSGGLHIVDLRLFDSRSGELLRVFENGVRQKVPFCTEVASVSLALDGPTAVVQVRDGSRAMAIVISLLGGGDSSQSQPV